MKGGDTVELNQDCIRDILLTIEGMNYTLEGLTKEKFEKTDRMQKYDSIQILYTLKRLFDAGFIKVLFAKGEAFYAFYNVHSMTYEGHQLLDSIRDDHIWSETKKRASKVSSVSIPVLQNIATSVMNKYLGLD
nr:DUF2513 domain-containing protein [Mammaliicoccus sciuri]